MTSTDIEKTAETAAPVQDADRAALADYCASRAQTYALFARVIDREVNDDLRELVLQTCAGLAAQGAGDAGADAPADDPEREVVAGLLAMGAELEDYDEDVQNDLACDYARVFLASGSYEDKAATPYESVYTSEEHLLMQDARDQVRALYRAARVMPNTNDTIPEDFAAFELDYMSALNDRMAAALSGASQDDPLALAQGQASFYRDHIANWMGMMLDDVDRVSTTPFYHAFARAFRGFIACEAGDVADLADAARPFARCGDEAACAADR